jgi:hypothetical protein
MGHILYIIPIWALATAWLYFLTCLAPAVDAVSRKVLSKKYTESEITL